MTRLQIGLTVLVIGVLPEVTGAQGLPFPYAMPEKPIKLTPAAATAIAGSRTVALVVRDVGRLEVTGADPKKGTMTVVRRGGIRRAVSEEKAHAELTDAVRKWGRFSVVNDPTQADLVFVVFEDAVPASRLSRASGDAKSRLRDRLAVYPGGTATGGALWFDEARESTLGALTGSPVGKVFDDFREELEKTEKKRQ